MDRGKGEPAFVIKFRDEDTSSRLRSKLVKILETIEWIDRLEAHPSEERQSLSVWEIQRNRKINVSSPEPIELFVEDTRPATFDSISVPTYTKKFNLLDDKNEADDLTKRPVPRGPECFNCGENHMIKDCPYPKNYNKINQKRNEMRAMSNNKNSRYYEDDQAQENGVAPGRISKDLRNALGLKKHQLPLHIYKMRKLGYPPGWLLHAKVSHSGIALFDSSGNVVDSNDDSVSSKDEYDIKKILDFPGFNVPHSSKYIDECDVLGYPPYNDEHSKMLMVERLAPRAAIAYKRKKMTALQSQKSENTSQHMDMDLDSDECEDSVNGNHKRIPEMVYGPPPNLTMMMPHYPLLPLPPGMVPISPFQLPSLPLPPGVCPPLPPPLPPTELPPLPETDLSIPLPDDKVNEDVEEDKKSTSADEDSAIDCDSLSLTDLESQRQSLMAALQEKEDSLNEDIAATDDSVIILDSSMNNTIINLDSSACSEAQENEPISNKVPLTPNQGNVRMSVLGSPMFSVTKYNDLPASDKFSKDICDVINFENLPDSTGKYEQISGVIKKIRNAVAQLQQE